MFQRSSSVLRRKSFNIVLADPATGGKVHSLELEAFHEVPTIDSRGLFASLRRQELFLNQALVT
jgi:hypothetical protein